MYENIVHTGTNCHKKVLILSNTGLGNIILFLPAYRLLRSNLLGAEFTVVLDSRWHGDSFFTAQFGDDANYIRLPKHKSEPFQFIAAIRRLRAQKFDLCFMPYNGPSKKIGFLLHLINAKRTAYFKTGFKLLDRFFKPCLEVITGEHYVDRNLHQIAKFVNNVKSIETSWISVAKDNQYHINEFKGHDVWIGIHPGVNYAFNAARQWPLLHFDKLISLILKNSNTKVVLFGKGREDANSARLLMMNRQDLCISIIGRDLSEVTAYMSRCDLFIGNDSGMMNLSVGLGIPTVGILGPTDPRHTGPWGDKHRTARLEFDCSPCFDSGYSLKCKHRHCLTEMKPEYVFEKVEDLLNHVK